MHRFGVTLGGLVLLPSVSAFATRRVGLRAHGFCFSGCAVSEIAARRVGLRAHGFRFSARTASELPLGGLVLLPSASGLSSAGWPSDSPLPLFGTHRFGVAARRVGASAQRVGSSAFRFGDCRSVGWPSGSPLPLFGMRRSAPPHRRREGRRSTPTRHLFHFKTLIPTC